MQTLHHLMLYCEPALSSTLLRTCVVLPLDNVNILYKYIIRLEQPLYILYKMHNIDAYRILLYDEKRAFITIIGGCRPGQARAKPRLNWWFYARASYTVIHMTEDIREIAGICKQQNGRNEDWRQEIVQRN